MPDHYANDSMTPAPISVSRDSQGNEVASDSPMHDNSTPGMGAFNYGAPHYNDDVKSGSGVSAPGVSRETTTVDNSKSPMKRPDNG